MNLKTCPKLLTVIPTVVWLSVAAMPAHGQAPVIESFGQNGLLVCTNLQPGSTASVEWASSVLGPWTNKWSGLDSVTTDSNGTIRVSVPMFYRVRGVTRITNSVPSGMVLIPAGSFTMGDTFGEGETGELPLHSVNVSAFYMDKYEVTTALWDSVHTWGLNHGYSFESTGFTKGKNHPVVSIAWFDAVKWCNARSEREGKKPAYYTNVGLSSRYRNGQLKPYVDWNSGYRLPTEAEWEKAARGGASGHRFPWSDLDTITHGQANYFSSTNDVYDTSLTRGYHPAFATGDEPYTSPPGSFAPNGYGLYDMAGNATEWCWDWYGAYSSASQSDPRGPASGSTRVFRGGSWRRQDSRHAHECRVAFRNDFHPTDFDWDNGFRLVLPAGQP